MRRSDAALALSCLAALLAGACGGEAGPHAPGSESFLSPPPGGAAGVADAPGAGTGPPAPGGAPADAGGGSAPRAVVEADIYQRSGSTLYVLNAYRGLEIVDIGDMSAPRLLGRVPVTATPVDLYLRGSAALVVVNDWFEYLPAADGARPARGSRLLAVDVSSPAEPRVTADLPVEGQIEQTRVVGDVLYVVSRRYWWYDWTAGGTARAPSESADTVYVASYRLGDPARPVPVERVEFPASGWSTHANVTAERATLSFAGWDLLDGGGYGPVTHFRVVDISDPAGAMTLGAAFAAQGTVQDRWGMDFDAGTGLFRAVLGGAGNGGASLAIWSSPTPEAASPLSRLDIDVPESLTAARFDGGRVYVVTARRIDPLWAIDASDPAHPLLSGSLTMPGQLDFIEPRGDRLVALGHTGEAGMPFQLAVSLLDVAELSAPRLLSRVPFGESFGWIGAQADDVRKAFIVLDPPPAGPGLVLVPVQGWDQETYAFRGGTQLLDFASDALALRGFLEHPGIVLRSFPVDEAGARLVALSDSALQTVDAADRDAPREMARLDLARSVTTLALVQGKAVELSGDWYRGDTELAITDALDPDSPSPLARVKVAAPSARMFQDGDVVWLLARDFVTAHSWLEAVDLADPVHPVGRGRLDIAPEDAIGVGPGWWYYGDEAVLVGHALAVHRGAWTPGAGGNEVRVFDLADPDHPRLAARVELPGSAWSWGLTASGSYLWLTHFEWSPGEEMGRYYLDRVDLSVPSSPKLLPKINVPGVFFAASPTGLRVYTLETWWPSVGSNATPSNSNATTWMHALDLTPRGTARLTGSARLSGYPSGGVAQGDFAWLATSEWFSSGAVTRLSTVRLATMAVANEQSVEGGWAFVRRAAGGKLFVQASWQDQGILIYGLANPSRPAFERFFRTQGWVWDVVVGGGRAFFPSGPYGVPVVDLAGP